MDGLFPLISWIQIRKKCIWSMKASLFFILKYSINCFYLTVHCILYIGSFSLKDFWVLNFIPRWCWVTWTTRRRRPRQSRTGGFTPATSPTTTRPVTSSSSIDSKNSSKWRDFRCSLNYSSFWFQVEFVVKHFSIWGEIWKHFLSPLLLLNWSVI